MGRASGAAVGLAMAMLASAVARGEPCLDEGSGPSIGAISTVLRAAAGTALRCSPPRVSRVDRVPPNVVLSGASAYAISPDGTRVVRYRISETGVAEDRSFATPSGTTTFAVIGDGIVVGHGSAATFLPSGRRWSLWRPPEGTPRVARFATDGRDLYALAAVYRRDATAPEGESENGRMVYAPNGFRLPLPGCGAASRMTLVGDWRVVTGCERPSGVRFYNRRWELDSVVPDGGAASLYPWAPNRIGERVYLPSDEPPGIVSHDRATGRRMFELRLPRTPTAWKVDGDTLFLGDDSTIHVVDASNRSGPPRWVESIRLDAGSGFSPRRVEQIERVGDRLFAVIDGVAETADGFGRDERRLVTVDLPWGHPRPDPRCTTARADFERRSRLLERDRRSWRARSDAFAGRRSAYERAVEGWNRDRARYQTRADDLTRRIGEANARVAAIEAMPPGRSRDEAVLAWNAAAEALRREGQAMQADAAALQARVEPLRKEGSILGEEARLLVEREAALQAERSALESLAAALGLPAPASS